jgi:beta-N-acetylhexosaminidase
MAAMLCGCSADTVSSAVPEETETAAATPAPTPTPDPVQTYIDSLTLEQKVGQLFIVRPEAFTSLSDSSDINSEDTAGMTSWSDEMTSYLAKYPVGGIALFGKNITDPTQLSSFLSSLHSTAGVPLFLGVDEEGGIVARIANNGNFNVKKYSSMYAIGQTGDQANAYGVGSTIGSYLKEYGFNLDFAPDSDVYTNPNNKVIGTRSFSSDPQVAANMVNSAVQGFHSAGMMTCLKHFPGHGDTATDSHHGYAEADKTWAEMLQCEELPFESGISAGTDFIMAAHITTPNATSDGLPASLSKEMLTDKLRGELGYQGLIITDAMDMEAITNYYSSADAAVTSFNAGADIILMPQSLQEAYQGVLDAVNNGTISQDRLQASLYRIISVKMKYGIIQQ